MTDRVANLIEELAVARHARIGFALGLTFSLLVFLFFVGVPSTDRTPLIYLSLAVVLAVTSGALLTTLFVLFELRRVVNTR